MCICTSVGVRHQLTTANHSGVRIFGSVRTLPVVEGCSCSEKGKPENGRAHACLCLCVSMDLCACVCACKCVSRLAAARSAVRGCGVPILYTHYFVTATVTHTFGRTHAQTHTLSQRYCLSALAARNETQLISISGGGLLALSHVIGGARTRALFMLLACVCVVYVYCVFVCICVWVCVNLGNKRVRLCCDMGLRPQPQTALCSSARVFCPRRVYPTTIQAKLMFARWLAPRRGFSMCLV